MDEKLENDANAERCQSVSANTQQVNGESLCVCVCVSLVGTGKSVLVTTAVMPFSDRRRSTMLQQWCHASTLSNPTAEKLDIPGSSFLTT